MRVGRTHRSLLVLLFTAFLVGEVKGQTTTSGALAGVVTDQTKAVIPGADITISDNAKGTRQSTKTDSEGTYRFFFLAPAIYSLSATHAGFQGEKRTVTVLLGPAVSVNITLGVAQARTDVTVTDEAPLVQAVNGDVSATMARSQISELPNPGNDLTYVVQTAPGVVMNTDVQGGANFSILGMPGFSYLHTIDGMNDNDNEINLSLVGPLLLLLGQNQIQETTVVSTGYSGQFGGAAGGNVNYITRSGSNQLHGNAQYYWNGRILNANDWFRNAAGQGRPFSIANQWAGSLGGPILKNKLFFFLDSEGLRLLIPRQTYVTIPSPQFEAATLQHIAAKFGAQSPSAAFYKKIFDLYRAAPGASGAKAGFNIDDPTGCTGFDGLPAGVPCALQFISSRGRPSQDALTSGRVDWNAGPKDRMSLRLQYDSGTAAGVTDPISDAFDSDTRGPWWQGQILETHTSGSSAANQFLVAGSYQGLIYRVTDPSRALTTFPTTLNIGPGSFNSLGGGDYFLAFGFGKYATQYQAADDYVRVWRNHKIGVGTNIERILWTRLPNRSGNIGQLNANTLRAFFEGGVINPNSPGEDLTFLSQSFTSQHDLRISFLNFFLYGEDEWRARRNLTLTFALRAEHHSNPRCRDGCFARLTGPFNAISHDPAVPYDKSILVNQRQAFQTTDSILWSPRFSFAWQPEGVSHNAVLRGGFGVFYDPLPGRLVDFFTGNPPLLNSYVVSADNLAPGESKNLFKDAAASNAAFLEAFATGQAITPGVAPPNVNTVERRTHSPQYLRWSLELQEGLGANTAVNLGYFGHHGIHELTTNPNANAFGFGSLPAGICASPPVPPCADPRFSGVTELNTNAISNYAGMVASFRHRWGQGLFQANYTYSHALDENSSGGIFIFQSQSLTSPQDPNNLRGSYGSADHDVRHSLNANYVWDVPVKAALGGRGWNFLVNGWQVSGTVFARTGFPYTVFDFQESGALVANNYFGLLYAVPAGPLGPDLPCGKGAAFPLATHPCQPPQVLADGTTPNPSARFVQSGCITGFDRGNLPSPSGPCGGPPVAFAQGRNRFRGPGYFNTDFTVVKSTKVPRWENATLRLGVQFFNLFNHPNFGFPDPGLASGTFGLIGGLEQPPTGILGAELGGDVAPRMIQLKAELKF